MTGAAKSAGFSISRETLFGIDTAEKKKCRFYEKQGRDPGSVVTKVFVCGTGEQKHD